MSDEEYDELFTKNVPIIFNFHGYPSLIHELTYKRANRNLHVHGYIEEGTITTTFDIRVQNRIDRFHIAISALKEIKRYKQKEKDVCINWCLNMLNEHEKYIAENGIDMEYIRDYKFERNW